MSKVGGALPAWYWPEGIPRRSPVPQQTLDRQIKRASSRDVEKPALVWRDASITFGELLEKATRHGQVLAVMLKDDEVVLIAERDPGRAVELTLAVIMTGKRALLADLDAPERCAAQIAQAGATAAVTAGDFGATGSPGGLRVVTRDELDAYTDETAKLRSVKATAPAVIIPAGDELAVHSNYTLAAMAVSVAAFIPELKTMSAVAPPPLWRWESLMLVFCALAHAGTVIAEPFENLSAVDGFVPAESYAVLLRDEADEIETSKRAPAVLRDLKYVFVSTPYFKPNWRRGVESVRGREVLTVWGEPAFGPAVAAHPTWFPFDAHGIPLVNVRVLPMDPNSGKPSLVPWEMLERAEIGVESPAMMTGFVREEAAADMMSGKIIRTHLNASVDHVGIVALHKPPRRRAA